MNIFCLVFVFVAECPGHPLCGKHVFCRDRRLSSVATEDMPSVATEDTSSVATEDMSSVATEDMSSMDTEDMSS